MKRIGQRVRILGGYRVYLDEPVDVVGIGCVRDDLWEGSALKTLMLLVPTETNDE